jgi:hypothetical protein
MQTDKIDNQSPEATTETHKQSWLDYCRRELDKSITEYRKITASYKSAMEHHQHKKAI